MGRYRASTSANVWQFDLQSRIYLQNNQNPQVRILGLDCFVSGLNNSQFYNKIIPFPGYAVTSSNRNLNAVTVSTSVEFNSERILHHSRTRWDRRYPAIKCPLPHSSEPVEFLHIRSFVLYCINFRHSMLSTEHMTVCNQVSNSSVSHSVLQFSQG